MSAKSFLVASFCFLVTVGLAPAQQCLTIQCPSNLVVQCPGNLPPRAASIGQFLLFGGRIQDSCSSNYSLTATDGPLTGGTCGGTISRTYVVRDSLSNSASCTQTITVSDTLSPVLIGVPGPTNFQCLGALPPANVRATDNCDGTNVPVQLIVTTNGSCPKIIVRRWTASDRCGNSATATQVITVQDTIRPVIVCPSNLVVQCLGDVPPCASSLAAFRAGGGGVFDNCGTNLLYFCSDGPLVGGRCNGTITRTHTVIDACSNSATCTQTITVRDTIPPVLIGVPPSGTVQCLSDLNFPGVTATDNCDGDVPVTRLCTTNAFGNSLSNSSCFKFITCRWSALDSCSNSVIAIRTNSVRDTIPPVLIGVPPSGAFQCLSDVNFPVVTATDNCNGDVAVTRVCTTNSVVSNNSSNIPCTVFITCRWTAIDFCSNSVTAFRTNIVRDTLAPVIVCPPPISVPGCTNQPVAYPVSVTDNCDPSPVLICLPPSGSSFALGSTLVTCQAIDRCSNRSACTFTVTVVCVSTPCLTITNEHSACGSNGTFVSTFELKNLTPDPVSFVAFTDLPPGVTVEPDLIHLAAPLPTGASTAITVMVHDGNAVRLTNMCLRISIHTVNFLECCAIQHCIPVPNCCMEITGQSLQCTNPPGSFTYSFDLQNFSGVPAKYLFLAPVPDCFDFVPDIITLQPPLPIGGLRHFSVTVQNVQPACGASLCFLVALLDSNLVQCCAITNCLPNPALATIECPSNRVVQCVGPAGTPVSFEVHASSLCSTSLPVTCTPPSGSLFPPGTTTVNCQTTSGGVIEKCKFTVSVVGNCTNPCVELRCSSNIVVQCQNPAGTPVTFSTFALNHCSSNLAVSCVPPSGSLFPLGITPVNCEAIASAPAETNRCSFNVTVLGNCSSNPCVTIRCPSNLVVQCVKDVPPAAKTLAQFLAQGGAVTAICNSNLTVTSSDIPLTGGPCGGTITRIYTVVDALENAASCTQTITVHDTIPPVLTVPGDLTVGCKDSTAPGRGSHATATDNCDVAAIDNSESVWINEFHYDNTGGDTNEFIELAGVAGTDLTGCSLVLYNGTDGLPYDTINLSGVIDDEGCGVGALAFAAPGIQNGSPDGIALALCLGQTIVQFISYEGTVTATGGPANGMSSIDVGVKEDPAPAPGQSLQLSGSGSTGGSFSWIGPAASSPGTLNAGQAITPCGHFTVISYTDSVVTGPCPQARTITRTWTATDFCGNSTSLPQIITVRDATAPTLVCPSNLVVTTCGTVPAPVTYPVSATDDCDTNVAVKCTPPSGSVLTVGNHVVNCTATDACSNSVTCTFIVRVVDICTNTCVEIHCPSNQVAQCQGPLGARVNFSLAIINLCGSNPPPAFCNPPSGTLFPPGTTVVNCQATVLGTTNRCQFTVTVLGNCSSNPCVELRCPSNLTFACVSPAGTPVSYATFATNRCSTNLSFNCTPSSGSTFPPGLSTVRCTAIGNGFTNLCNFTVAVTGPCPVPAPMLLVVARVGGIVELSMQTTAGVTCYVECADSFDSSDWKIFRTIVGDGSTMVITDWDTSASQRFYRLRMDP